MANRNAYSHKDPLLFLAEDDNDDVFLFKQAIADIDIRPDLYVYNDGQQLLNALGMVTPQTPDFIFLDIDMPVKNGFETLVDIRKFYSGKVPVFFLSTSLDEDTIENARRWGATGYLSKLSSFSGLKQVLSDVLLKDWSKRLGQDFYVRIQFDRFH